MPKNQTFEQHGSVFPRRQKHAEKTLDKAVEDYQKAALAVNLFQSKEWHFLMDTLFKIINECTKEILDHSKEPIKNAEYLTQLTATRNAYLSIIRTICLSEEALAKAEKDIEAAESMGTNMNEPIGTADPSDIVQR